MRIVFFLATIMLLSCGQNTAKQKEITVSTDTALPISDTAKIPAKTATAVHHSPDETSVNAALSDQYGNQWHVLHDGEAHWMKDAFDYFIIPKRKTDPNYPYITRGDFNADGKPDLAAVITDSLQKKYQVAILLDTSKIILWDEDILDDAALSTVPKSVVEGMDGEKTKK